MVFGNSFVASVEAPPSPSLWDQAAEAMNDFLPTGSIKGKSSLSPSTVAAGLSFLPHSEGRDDDAAAGNGEVRTDAGGEEKRGADQLPEISKSRSEMYRLIKRRKWGEVLQRVEQDSSEAKTWIAEWNMNGSLQWRMLPLHLACEMQCPTGVVQALIKAYPPTVTTTDSGGELPIHFAFRTNSTETSPTPESPKASSSDQRTREIVQALISSDPRCASMPNEAGRLALHLACRRGGSSMEAVVDELLLRNHRGSDSRDAYGLLPLHHAVLDGKATLHTVESLLRAHPHSVALRDNWGRTPLEIVRGNTYKDTEAGNQIAEALEKDTSHWTSARLLSENSSLKDQLAEQQKGLLEAELVGVDLEESTAKIAKLRDELSEALKAKESLEIEKTAAEMKLEELEARASEEMANLVVRAEEEKEEAKEQLEVRIKGLEKQAKQQKYRLEARAAEEREQLESKEAQEKGRLEGRIKELEKKAKQMDALSVVHKTLEEENCRLLEEMEAKAARLVAAKKKIGEFKMQEKALRADKKVLQGEKERLQDEVDDLERKQGLLRNELNEKDAKISSLEKEVTKMDNFHEEIRLIRRGNKRLEADNERTEAENLRLKEDMEEKAALLRDANNMLEAVENERDRLQAQSDRLADSLADLRDEVEATEEERSQLRSENDVLEKENERLMRAATAAAEEIVVVEGERNSFEGQARDLERKLERLTGIFREMERERNRSMTDTDDWLQKASSFIYGQDHRQEGGSLRTATMRTSSSGGSFRSATMRTSSRKMRDQSIREPRHRGEGWLDRDSN